MSVVQFWDNMYRDLTAPVTFGRGGNPSAEVISAAEKLPAGSRVIDIGCGDGRNALYLAALGHDVTAIDVSPVGIAKVCQFAAERDLQLDASVQDIREYTFTTDYQLMVSMGVLHLIEREYWLPLLRQIQQHTNIGGYNAIGVFNDLLPAPDDQKDYYIGLFKDGELFEYYAGWEILAQRKHQFHDEHPGGIRHHHSRDVLLARKV